MTDAVLGEEPVVAAVEVKEEVVQEETNAMGLKLDLPLILLEGSLLTEHD